MHARVFQFNASLTVVLTRQPAPAPRSVPPNRFRASLNTLDNVNTKLAENVDGGGGLLSAFGAWRRQGRRQQRPETAHGRRKVEEIWGWGRGKAAAALRELENVRPHDESKSTEIEGDASSTAPDVVGGAAVATATASSAAGGGGCDVRRDESGGVARDGGAGSGVVGDEACVDGSAVCGRRVLTYDGEGVLPQTWAKVWFLFEERQEVEAAFFI